MSESAVAAPPAGGQANSQALLASAVQMAQSPLESGLEWVPENAPQPQPDNQFASGPDDFQRRAEAARAKDNPQLATQQARQDAQQQQAATEGQQAQPEKKDSALQWKPKKAADWEAREKTHNQKVAALQAELDQLKQGKAPTNQQAAAPQEIDITQDDRYKALLKERDEYLDVVKLTRAEMDPEFKAKFDSRREAALNIAKQFSGGARERIVEILNMPSGDLRDSALADAIKDFNPSAKAKLAAVAGQLDVIDVEKQIELQSRKATWEHRVRQEQEQAQQRTREQEQKIRLAFSRELQRWQDPENGMPFTMAKDQNDPHLKRIATTAENIMFGRLKDDGELAQVAMKAAAFDDVIHYSNKLAEEYETLLTNYNRVMGVQPDATYAAPPQSGQISNAGAGHGVPVGSTPLVMQGLTDFHSNLAAAQRADAAKRY